ncbi:MAG: superoxide dismutase [Bacteroidales bacterium]|nr:superoxide dismutase [Bacteroidales bacterium]
MAITLPQLSYPLTYLEPVISSRTMEFHYGKHHKAYVDKLNSLIPGTPFENATLETIIRESEGSIFNNGAQVWNHTFYFECLSKNPKAAPEGKLLESINESFGSFESFKEKFTDSGITLFGSGWVWLVVNANNHIEIVKELNAGNPLRKGLKPILTCDVWEHAYYLDYQNARPAYLKEFWKIVNWKVAEDRFYS